LPTACSRSFQPDAGSHTSTLMSESGLGVSVAAILQNEGSAAYVLAAAAGGGFPGGVN
jgi:hypothetical protein